MQDGKGPGMLNLEQPPQTEDATVNIDSIKARLFDELYEAFMEGDADGTDITIRLADYKHVMDIIKYQEGTEA